MTDGINIIWPERRFVPAAKINVWYSDAIANGEVDDGDLGIPDAEFQRQARVLAYIGFITIGAAS